MKHYRVLLEGEPLTIEIDGQLQEVGFAVTRFVEAPDSHAAAARAVQLVRSDPKLQESADHAELERLHITVGNVEEIPPKESSRPQPGFAFYPADGASH